MIDFKKLIVWKKAHEFVLDVYKITKGFPHEESYGLTSQLRRAAFSIPNNIAEGCGRSSEKELKRSLAISLGSASEVELLNVIDSCELVPAAPVAPVLPVEPVAPVEPVSPFKPVLVKCTDSSSAALNVLLLAK